MPVINTLNFARKLPLSVRAIHSELKEVALSFGTVFVDGLSWVVHHSDMMVTTVSGSAYEHSCMKETVRGISQPLILLWVFRAVAESAGSKTDALQERCSQFEGRRYS